MGMLDQGCDGSLVTLERVAEQMEGGRPQANENGAALGISPRILVDRLGANPQAQAKADRPQRKGVQVLASQADAV